MYEYAPTIPSLWPTVKGLPPAACRRARSRPTPCRIYDSTSRIRLAGQRDELLVRRRRHRAQPLHLYAFLFFRRSSQMADDDSLQQL